MSESAVDVNLAVSVAGSRVMATLVFRNTSDKVVFLDPLMACLDGRVRHKVFRIQSGRQTVPYLPPLAKRRAPDPKDFVRLLAGASLKAEARLDEAYGFFVGTHEYRAVYDAFHDQPESDDLYEFVSNEVVFTVTK